MSRLSKALSVFVTLWIWATLVFAQSDVLADLINQYTDLYEEGRYAEATSIAAQAVDLGRQVFEAAPQPKRWYVVPGADHNDVPFVGGEPYYREMLNFIQSIVP